MLQPHPPSPSKRYTSPSSGEVKEHYNTVQAFSKIVLVEAWLTKSPNNELWGTIYSKGWGDP